MVCRKFGELDRLQHEYWYLGIVSLKPRWFKNYMLKISEDFYDFEQYTNWIEVIFCYLIIDYISKKLKEFEGKWMLKIENIHNRKLMIENWNQS